MLAYDSWLEQICQRQDDLSAAQDAMDKLRERKQTLIAENTKLRVRLISLHLVYLYYLNLYSLVDVERDPEYHHNTQAVAGFGRTLC